MGPTAILIFSTGHASFLSITGQGICFEHHLHLAALSIEFECIGNKENEERGETFDGDTRRKSAC